MQSLWHARGLPGTFWTPDGRYLAAWGDPSLRLWNLRGQVRGVVPDLRLKAGQRMFGRQINQVWLQDQAVCLRVTLTFGPAGALAPVLPDGPPWPAEVLTSVTTMLAYHWPTLAPKEEAACRRP
ncbi:hypothetical protein K7W42_00825 [Deinococcus sp. HMF7604]|uniref:hypothetical protein n=1 Tax=Deinococcus betulae TaxID=2873312 RepID=UPI001CCFC659|nr:hypothetical protein [Deinococcus betulae]MBZ9749395.1 hypothetical protein [Deinococcus betulae]